MKMHRVMFNDLKRGTGVQVDRICTEKEAKSLMKKFRKMHPEVNFFTQEYEEGRDQIGSSTGGRL